MRPPCSIIKLWANHKTRGGIKNTLYTLKNYIYKIQLTHTAYFFTSLRQQIQNCAYMTLYVRKKYEIYVVQPTLF